MAFLDFTGLARYLTRLKEIFASKDKFTRSDDGLVPHPNTVTQTHYLREDGSWQVPPDTTYRQASTTSDGLIPKLPTDAASTKYLNGALEWVPIDNDETPLPVNKGGTGATTLTANQVLLGNGTSYISTTSTKGEGALYREYPNGIPKFDTLPVAYGGTGATSIDDIKSNFGINDIMLRLSTIENALNTMYSRLWEYSGEAYGNGLTVMRCGTLRVGRFTAQYASSPTWTLQEIDYPSGTTYGCQLVAQDSSATVFPVVNADSNTLYFAVRNGTWTKGWIWGEVIWFSKTAAS